MRSNRSTPHSSREASICCTPNALNTVHTLVAENNRPFLLTCLRQYPITASEEPYMGEESIRVPPRSKNVCTTRAQSERCLSSLPTLKVSHVPRPMAGIFSPVEGIARVRMGPVAARLLENGGIVAAAASECT